MVLLMSLIIAYVGKKGCVMAADKRRIAYFGNKEDREQLEEELYSGSITNDDELKKRASDLDITLKISDDANKIRFIEDVVVGEVASKGTQEVKRKRVYGTTNGYQIIEMLGSNVTDTQKGSKAIVIFGNRISKSLANDLISQRWKSDVSLKYMGDIFEDILKTISEKTPSLGKNWDVLIKNGNFKEEEAQLYLDETIERDVKLLGKFREKLASDLLKQSETIQLASKIIDEGDIGKVAIVDGSMLQVTLNSNVQAYNTNWKQLAKPGENVLLIIDEDERAEIGDEVIIENETLCLKKSKARLKCDIILCNI